MDDVTKLDAEMNTKAIVEMNAKPFKVESWKYLIHHTIEVVQWFTQGLGSFNKVVVEDCMQPHKS